MNSRMTITYVKGQFCSVQLGIFFALWCVSRLPCFTRVSCYCEPSKLSKGGSDWCQVALLQQSVCPLSSLQATVFSSHLLSGFFGRMVILL
jgi:hypothetical protein